MIRSFRDKRTEAIFGREAIRGFPNDVSRQARVKLNILNAAEQIDDLRVPPGNRLEKLSGNRAGQHSIRINDQWRVCFRWHDDNAFEVEVTDYH